ncbi:MAG: HEAT repeat domain-containing protein, partial [Nitrosopumilus sp.]
MIFSNKSTISLKTNKTNTPNNILHLSDIQEGTEIATNNKYQFTEKDLVETITQTTLFSSRGPNLFGFAHWTYAEFLSAFYIKLHKIPFEKIKSLVFTYDDIDMMLVPQLREAVAWICTQSPELSKIVIKNDPKALLTGDIQILSNNQRYDLVESLLDKFAKKKISDSDWGLYWLYKKLNHPQIADQLKQYIENKSNSFLVRRIAIDIAEVCNIKKLQKLLVDISLNKSEDVYIRHQAAYAIHKIGDVKSKMRLRNIIEKPIPEDLDDDLRGSVLLSIWPGILSTKEVFTYITKPQRDSYHGIYQMFLGQIPDQIEVKDLPIALNWVKKISNKELRGNHRFTNFADEVLFKGYMNLDDPTVLETFADVAIKRLENDLDVFPIPFSIDKEKSVPELSNDLRRNLVESIINKIDKYPERFLIIYTGNQRLLLNHDMKWLIKKLSKEPNNDKINIWAQIIREVYNISISSHTDIVLQARESCAVLAEKFEDLFSPVEIDSPRAKILREQYERHKEWEKRQAERIKEHEKRNKDIDVLKLIVDSLERFEKGDLNVWWFMVCKQINIGVVNNEFCQIDSVDITQLPGWKLCDNNIKKRILLAAKKYILNARCKPEEWIGQKDLYYPDMAGYQALVLIKKHDPDFVKSLKPKVWRNWAPIIIGYPEHFVKVEEGNIHYDLIKITYKHA